MEKMTDTANTSAETPLEEVPKIKVKFYRNRRICRAALMSFGIFCASGSLFLFLLSHVMSTLFWDWWFFTHKRYRDSTQAPEAYFKWANVTLQQMDEFNDFMIKLRRIAFVVSGMIALTCWMFVEEVGYYTAFLFTYVPGVFFTAVIAERMGKIKYPYPRQRKFAKHIFPFEVPFYNAASDSKLANPFAK
jgi:hypothetical protein